MADIKKYSKPIALLAGPLAFFLIMHLEIEGMTTAAQGVLASTVWISIWWITEAIPIPVTALLPIILFPLTNGLALKTTTTTYFSPMIVLFLGGFIIALAIERWNLHQRIALHVIHLLGTNSRNIIMGFMLATYFMSMWISNTATALMMLPIAMSIINKLNELTGEKQSNFGITLMLGIAYSASIGGMTTLIGTPTNPIFAGIVSNSFATEITFSNWISIGLPLSLILLVTAWVYLIFVADPVKERKIEGASVLIKEQLQKLGPISYEERVVLTVFSCTAVAWILRSGVLSKVVTGIHDSIIALVGAVILFIIPTKDNKGNIMDWSYTSKLPWGILILFGGGLSIAAGFKESGLAAWFGEELRIFEGVPVLLLIFIVVLLVNFLTEVTSNVATASVFLPILAALATSLNIHPFTVMVPATFAASCAFMLPVATPPNAVVFSSGLLSIKKMFRVGLLMNMMSSILITLFIYYIMPLIWEIDLFSFPANFK